MSGGSEDRELEEILKKKMKQYLIFMEQKKRASEERKKRDEARKRLLRQLMDEEAFSYLTSLEKEDPELAKKLSEVVIGLFARRLVVRPLSKIDLMYIERRLKGERSRIYVKSREGTFSLSDFLRKRTDN